MEIFGFNVGKKKKTASKKSFSDPIPSDGSLILSNGYNSYTNGVLFDGVIKNDTDLINQYRRLAQDPVVANIIEDYCNDAIMTDDNCPITINLDKVLEFAKNNNVPIDQEIVDKIFKEFDVILSLMGSEEHFYDIFRRFFIDGRLYYHCIVDEKNEKKGIQELRFVDPRAIKKVVEYQKYQDPQTGLLLTDESKIDTYYIYSEHSIVNTYSSSSQLKISPDSIVYIHSGILDESGNHVLSELHSGIKAVNKKNMMEDSLLTYRIARAPERLVFQIATGRLPAHKAEELLQKHMANYRNKMTQDLQTGELADTRRHLSMQEDFWFTKPEGSAGSEVSSLPGGSNFGDIDDVKMFKKAVYEAFGIPASRLEQENGFTLGKVSEITRDELKFQKKIFRLQKRFGAIFKQVLQRQLALKNILSPEAWDAISTIITINFNTDSFFFMSKQIEMFREKINLLSEADQLVGKYISKEYLMQDVLQFDMKARENIENAIEDEGIAPITVKPMNLNVSIDSNKQEILSSEVEKE
jgi:hypothetical protein